MMIQFYKNVEVIHHHHHESFPNLIDFHPVPLLITKVYQLSADLLVVAADHLLVNTADLAVAVAADFAVVVVGADLLVVIVAAAAVVAAVVAAAAVGVDVAVYILKI